ncbi:unnamed protein product [Spodoptera littoralis]|uniref:Uncharacterized protein n=1 Tax=Spodoptera littoralis TaxID=7109 RepID=A0A9P0I6I6_SPOLI|nr:unnamed protein product [Spodoptera littoralis]CAH1640852.1 unnamed protein product [Spodoptera littoralis]
MAVAISFVFLFGLISCTIGKPVDNSLYGIEGLLKALTQQSGKFDIAISHHEDGPKSHHEDKARISPHDASELDESEESQPTPNDVQSIYNLHTKADKVPQPQEGDILIEKHQDALMCSTDSDEGDSLRCAGNACGTSRDDAPCNQCNRNGEELLRCNGNRCSIRDDNDQDGRDNLRCAGNRCGRNRDDTNVMRCRGKPCSVARHNENNETQWQPKRVKLSDNVDAVILDADDLQRLLYGDSTRTNNLSPELIWSPSNETSVRTFNGNSDEVAKFLNKLDKELGLTVGNDYDNKLEYNNNDNNRDNTDTSNNNDERNNANYNQHLRCIGDRCSRRANDVYYNDDDEYNRYDGADGNKNILRCSGASCSSDSDDYDDNEFTDDDDTRMDSKVALTISELGLNNLRCRGNLCTYTDDSNGLRCIGNRCARDRDVDDGDIVDRIKLEGLRCNGNRCNRDTDDENYDIKAVRCSENRCSRPETITKMTPIS